MLTSRQKSHLAGLAQTLEPQIQLGKGGPSAGLVSQLDRILADHELVKLRFVDFKESRQELATELASSTKSELVRVIGNVAVLFRRNPDPKKRKIDFGDL
ncbi:MAG TPA: YhbY family RNA-binding protein [Spirochaetia bacterium]|nr:YhbY family RNA-binding protein [Spirochaetales bacterium]HRY71585.1 YhbY family RNA-binding protein [Spirochaetia bacterium]